jgi:hypothetical protein
VTVDGKPLADKLDGTALSVDIGEHVFTFEVAGQPPITRTLVLTEGEKGRRERIAIAAATPSTPAPVPPPAPSPAPVPEGSAPAGVAPLLSATETPPTGGGMGTQKVLGLVAGGVGVVGIGVGSVFGLLTLSQKSQQQSDCGGPCSAASHAQALNDHATGMTDGTISTVGFIAGGALLVGGAVLFFAAGRSPEQSAATGMVIAPSAGPRGGGLSLRGEF